MGKFYQSIQSYGPSFMTKFCSALYLENLLTNIFAKGFSRKIYLGDTELNRIFFIVVVGVQTVSVSLVVGVVDISISWVVGLIPRWIYFWWVS